MKQTYKIAEKIIEIDSIHEEVHDYCRDYLCDGEPDFIVTTTENDIEYERQKSARNDIAEGRPVMSWSADLLVQP